MSSPVITRTSAPN